MKMSNESYEMFTKFYNYMVENANDKEIKIILATVYKLAKTLSEEQEKRNIK